MTVSSICAVWTEPGTDSGVPWQKRRTMGDAGCTRWRPARLPVIRPRSGPKLLGRGFPRWPVDRKLLVRSRGISQFATIRPEFEPILASRGKKATVSTHRFMD